MSHVVIKEGETADQQIVDLAALKSAASGVGMEFRKGQTSFHTWASDHGGRLVGDYPVPAGYDATEIAAGDCIHAIGLPGQSGKSGTNAYEVGVVKSKKFPGTYSLLYDFWGGAIDRVAGIGLEKLRMHYTAHAVKNKHEAEGDTVLMEELPNGEIRLNIDPTTRLAAQGLI